MENKQPAPDKLIVLSIVIKTVYRNLLKDEERNEILPYFNSLMSKPLIKFFEAHNSFFVGIAATSDLFDRWLSIQLQVITLLGDDRIALIQLGEAMDTIMAGAGVDKKYDVQEKGLYLNIGFSILLAFRVYLDDIMEEDLMAGNFPLLNAQETEA